MQPVQLEPVEPGPGLGQCRGSAGAAEQQRQRHVFLGGQLRDELAELKHEPEPVAPQRAALRLAHPVDAATGKVDLP
jgi:hypothetical protein